MTNEKKKRVSKKGLLTPFIDKEEDLLGSDSSNWTPPEEQPSVEKPKNKVLLGYHPITGAEVW
mgnify:CR=1 FL=1